MYAVEKKQQSLKGIVIGNKMQKTVKVLVKDKHKDKIYRKYVTVSRKFLVHADKILEVGSKVRIVPCAPISKNKAWKVAEVINE